MTVYNTEQYAEISHDGSMLMAVIVRGFRMTTGIDIRRACVALAEVQGVLLQSVPEHLRKDFHAELIAQTMNASRQTVVIDHPPQPEKKPEPAATRH